MTRTWHHLAPAGKRRTIAGVPSTAQSGTARAAALNYRHAGLAAARPQDKGQAGPAGSDLAGTRAPHTAAPPLFRRRGARRCPGNLRRQRGGAALASSSWRTRHPVFVLEHERRHESRFFASCSGCSGPFLFVSGFIFDRWWRLAAGGLARRARCSRRLVGIEARVLAAGHDPAGSTCSPISVTGTSSAERQRELGPGMRCRRQCGSGVAQRFSLGCVRRANVCMFAVSTPCRRVRQPARGNAVAAFASHRGCVRRSHPGTRVIVMSACGSRPALGPAARLARE